MACVPRRAEAGRTALFLSALEAAGLAAGLRAAAAGALPVFAEVRTAAVLFLSA